MPLLLAWLLILAIFIGNCGFWLFCFNRLNAAGFPRKFTKRSEKLLVFLCFAIPLSVFALEPKPLIAFLTATASWPSDARLFNIWSAFSAASIVILGPMWLESRFWLIPPKQLVQAEKRRFDVGELIGGSGNDRMTRFLASLPGNQIEQLEVSQKLLKVEKDIGLLEGFKIGHISDLHFTGQMRFEHYQAIIEQLAALEPDWIVLTGDIIDYPQYLDWVVSLLSRFNAPQGCSYLLGNHDARLPDIQPLLDRLNSIPGFYDVGKADQILTVNGERIGVYGNELPWFNRREIGPACLEQIQVAGPLKLNVGLSHSPDQIPWARSCGLDLLFAGHTHGGQARVPGIGPLIAPSWYGSKFASGVFYLEPTLMHVSRGIAGTHPLRWWCTPEVSLITLTGKSS